MAKYVKVGGTWKQVSPDVDSNIYANIKVGGSWKDITAAYIKVNGTWRQYWNYSAYIVPNVVGQNYLTAQTAITGSGNTVGTLTTLANAQGATPQNDKTVASQTIAAGKYTTQQTVGLSYYVFTYVTVPNIVGQTVSTGQTLVQNSGNTWGTGSYYNNAQGATAGNNNTILSQSPAAGQYATAQTVNYGYYLYTVPTPSAPTVSLVGSNPSSSPTSFSFTVSYGANTTSAIAYYGPQGNPTQTSLGSVSNGGTATASGLSPSTNYEFTAYAYNTVNVNTLGNQTTGPVAGNIGSVQTAAQPAPTTGTVTQSPSAGTSLAVGTVISGSTYGWDNSPTSVTVKIIRGTANVVQSETLMASSSGTTSASTSYTVQASDYNVSGVATYFKVFAQASNAGGNSPWTAAGNDIGPVLAPVTPPSGGSVTLNWLSGSGQAGSQMFTSASGWTGTSLSYYTVITTAIGRVPTINDTVVASGNSNFVTYTVSASDAVSPVNWFAAYNTASNSGGSLTVGPSNTLVAVSTPTTTLATASASNSYNAGTNNPWVWTLSITHTGGSVPTSYNGYFCESASSSGPDASSTYFSGTWTAGNLGTQTVTRNSYTYSWARWTNIYVVNGAGSSNASGSPTPYQ